MNSDYPWESLKILIVDDSRTIRKTAETLLKKEKIQVEAVEDGYAALAKVLDWQPDLVFIDVMMPKLDGYQTCEILKSQPSCPSVVLLSSKDGLIDRCRGEVVGANGYLTKPFTRDELIEVLRKEFPDRDPNKNKAVVLSNGLTLAPIDLPPGTLIAGDNSGK